MLTKEILIKTEDLMKKSLERMSKEFISIRTGSANVGLVENVKVECYNSISPLNQVAGITIPDAKTLEIRPWDAAILGDIEKALFKASIGITPVNDGKVIRLKVPPLTEERRHELAKVVHKLAEEFRVSLRNERHTALETVKKAEKEKKITEDDRFKTEALLQKLTEAYMKRIDEMAKAKEKEIMQQ